MVLRGFALLALLAAPYSHLQRSVTGRGGGESCFAANDLVVQALELIRPDSPANDLDNANQLLKRANDLCAESGEAWYFRSLLEAHLGHQPRAEFFARQAHLFPSDALRENVNPFVLSTPLLLASTSIRGLTAQPGHPNPSQPNPAQPNPAAPASRPPRKWALLIALSQFADPDVRRLSFTLQDATELASVLKDPAIGRFDPQDVRLLTNAGATTKNIKAALNAIARQAQPNDLVLIYVATHGSPRKLDSVGGVNYLVTYDTELYQGGKFNEDGLYSTAFPMVELANDVATRMKALKTVVILDTCYSGGAAGRQVDPSSRLKDSVPTTDMISHMGLGTGRVVISASSADEESYEDPKFSHGCFTYFLLQALRTSKPGTPITQLFGQVSAKVTQCAAAAGVAQHPTIYRSSAGADFPLADDGPKIASLR